jgi:hypothetical protein
VKSNLLEEGGNDDKISVLKVPRQCPLVLLNGGSREGKALRSEQGKALGRE